MTSQRQTNQVTQAQPAATGGRLQRTCACGQHTVGGGECESCRTKREGILQRVAISVPPVGPRFRHDFSQIPNYRHAAGTLQTKLAINKLGDEYEQEADRIADQVMTAPADRNVAAASPHIQRYSSQPSRQPDIAPASVDVALASSGRPLDQPLQQEMEQRFGYDFSRVRVHTGGAAEQSANDVNALAYTVGHNIVFDAGRFAPGTHDGRRLLSHELAHVVQQGSAIQSSLLQRKANATRFQDEPTLDEISDGKKVLKEKDTGEAVIRVTTALAELGHYTHPVIDERFDPPLTSAVKKYQAAKLLTGKAVDGSVDKPTLDELDKDFSASFRVERDVISKQKKPDLLKGTQDLDPAERAASNRAISTEIRPDPITGLLPTFKKNIVGEGTYEDNLRGMVEKIIIAEYNAMGKGKAVLHADPKNLYGGSTIDPLAEEASKAVDAVFGEYEAKKGTLPKLGVNVFDAWTYKVNELALGGKAEEDRAINWRVKKILTGKKKVKDIDKEFGAIQSRPDEKAIVDKVQQELTKKYRAELLETHKGWPGFEDNDKTYIQLFKGSDDDAKRSDMWRLYQTLIHEYIHSLEHANHKTYREGMSEQKGDKTLREGTTDYFTKIVWSSIKIDGALRAKIEGPLNDPKKPTTIPPLHTYDEADNAERLAGIVGIRNLAAAFFQGKVELIGKK